MKEKIISKANEMFIKLGFKSITMDDIAGEMSISKTIYKYFFTIKEILIEESTALMHTEIHEIINNIVSKEHNAIREKILRFEKCSKKCFNHQILLLSIN
jgi:AcrR family transcriptional regulator